MKTLLATLTLIIFMSGCAYAEDVIIKRDKDPLTGESVAYISTTSSDGTKTTEIVRTVPDGYQEPEITSVDGRPTKAVLRPDPLQGGTLTK